MPRKAKKKIHRMPKLSVGDQLAYWTIFVLLCAMWFGVIFVPLHLRHQITFADEMVIAAQDHASFLWIMVPWMTFFLMTFILWAMAYQDRKPIFGLRNFKYGPPAWPKVYPLFMKNKPYVWVSEKKKKDRKRIPVVLLTVLLVSCIPFPWSLYGRDCLQSDGSVAEYNMFNVQTHDFTSGEIASVEFEAYEHSVRSNTFRRRCDVRVCLTTDSGKTYTFAYREFRDEYTDDPYWLTAMLRLKSRYSPEIIKYSGVNNLESVISDNRLTEETAQMLYQLFGLA